MAKEIVPGELFCNNMLGRNLTLFFRGVPLAVFPTSEELINYTNASKSGTCKFEKYE